MVTYRAGISNKESLLKKTKPRSMASAIQPKLTIGQPNDKYEREADRVTHKNQSAVGTEKQSII